MLQRLTTTLDRALSFLSNKKEGQHAKQVISLLREETEELTRQAEEADKKIAELSSALEVVQRQAEGAEQRLQNAWKVLRKIEADRDEWNALFKRQWREHNNAQAILVTALERTRAQARSFQKALNKRRTEEGKKELKVSLLATDAPPADLAEKYKESMAKAEETGPPCGTKYPLSNL